MCGLVRGLTISGRKHRNLYMVEAGSREEREKKEIKKKKEERKKEASKAQARQSGGCNARQLGDC